MISNVGSAAVRNAYQDSSGTKDSSKVSTPVGKQGDTSEIEQLKSSIENGEYQLNLKALAEKIAGEIL